MFDTDRSGCPPWWGSGRMSWSNLWTSTTRFDLAGAPLPAADIYPVEGASLAPFLGSGGPAWRRKVALTMYPRCPPNASPGQDWVDDVCIHSVERSEFSFMGYSMRRSTRTSTGLQSLWRGTGPACPHSGAACTPRSCTTTRSRAHVAPSLTASRTRTWRRRHRQSCWQS